MKSKHFLYIAIAVAVIAALYFLLGNRIDRDSKAAGAATSEDDERTFRQMVEVLRGKIGNSNLAWVLPEVKHIVQTNGTGSGGQDYSGYRIDGRISKTGALTGVYSTSVSGWSKVGGADSSLWQEDKALTSQVFEMWYAFKTRNELL